MKGMPKHLNTKEDYLYVKDNYNKEYWQPLFKNLLDTRYDWFAISKEEYIDDDKHKIVKDEQEDREDYFEYRENENAPIYRLGFTVDEVEEMVEWNG